MIIDSPQWNPQLGICKKHATPSLPCQQCLNERDAEVEVRLEPIDQNIIDFDGRDGLRGYLPAGEIGDWLMTRLVV
mgnify:CR=1 FL=1